LEIPGEPGKYRLNAKLIQRRRREEKLLRGSSGRGKGSPPFALMGAPVWERYLAEY